MVSEGTAAESGNGGSGGNSGRKQKRLDRRKYPRRTRYRRRMPARRFFSRDQRSGRDTGGPSQRDTARALPIAAGYGQPMQYPRRAESWTRSTPPKTPAKRIRCTESKDARTGGPAPPATPSSLARYRYPTHISRLYRPYSPAYIHALPHATKRPANPKNKPKTRHKRKYIYNCDTLL